MSSRTARVIQRNLTSQHQNNNNNNNKALIVIFTKVHPSKSKSKARQNSILQKTTLVVVQVGFMDRKRNSKGNSEVESWLRYLGLYAAVCFPALKKEKELKPHIPRLYLESSP